jgi:hypothetical protein
MTLTHSTMATHKKNHLPGESVDVTPIINELNWYLLLIAKNKPLSLCPGLP